MVLRTTGGSDGTQPQLAPLSPQDLAQYLHHVGSLEHCPPAANVLHCPGVMLGSSSHSGPPCCSTLALPCPPSHLKPLVTPVTTSWKSLVFGICEDGSLTWCGSLTAYKEADVF